MYDRCLMSPVTMLHFTKVNITIEHYRSLVNIACPLLYYLSDITFLF